MIVLKLPTGKINSCHLDWNLKLPLCNSIATTRIQTTINSHTPDNIWPLAHACKLAAKCRSVYFKPPSKSITSNALLSLPCSGYNLTLSRPFLPYQTKPIVIVAFSTGIAILVCKISTSLGCIKLLPSAKTYLLVHSLMRLVQLWCRLSEQWMRVAVWVVCTDKRTRRTPRTLVPKHPHDCGRDVPCLHT